MSEEKVVKRPAKKQMSRKKICIFCADGVDELDYKDVAKLRKFITEKRQDCSQKNERYVCKAPKSCYRGCQESKRNGIAPICSRIIFYLLSFDKTDLRKPPKRTCTKISRM